MSERLRGKTAIITGAATGIGKAAARLFAAEGAQLILADINPHGSETLLNQICNDGGKAIFIQTDLTRADHVEAMVQKARSVFGRLDVLYNNAGVNLFARLTDTKEEDWDRVMTVNVKSVYLCCKYAIPLIIESGGGSIINTASAAAIVGLRNLAAYTASKGAVLQLSKNLALDYAANKIRVNALCPGVTATEMTMNVVETSPNPAAAKARFDSGRPLGRMAKPEEIARAALFLASDDSSFMTGTALVVDGGYTAE